jgi:Tol biopolymer transport system component
MAPPALERVVRACLSKDPDDRIQTAHDVSLQLRWEQETVSSAAAPAAPSAATRRAWRDWIPWSMAVLAVIAALAVWLTGGHGPSDADPVWTLIQVPPEMTLTSYGCNVVISPDGRTVAFAGQDSSGVSSDLWVRSLASTEARELSESGFASWPFWSPDGRFIAFFDQTASTLMKVQVEGGRPVTICAAANGRGGSWSADNEIVFAPAPAGPLMRVSAAGGSPRAVTRIDSTRGETAHRFPSFLPDGRHFMYTALPRGPAGFEVYVASLDGGEPVHLMTADSAPVFAPPGYLLFRRGDQIMAQRFDPRRRTLRGDPVAITGAPGPSDLDADPIASASANGRLVALETGSGDTRLELVDRSGATRRTYPLPAGAWRVLSTTPDGRRALIGKGQEIWFVDLERSIPTRLVTNLGTDASGVTSPDGRRVAYLKNREGREGIVVVDLAGRVEFEVYPDDLYKTVTDWSPDGRYIVYRALDPETDWDIWLLPTEGDHTPVQLIGGPDWDMNGRVSPDGRWMAYAARELEGPQVYVTSFPEPNFKVRVTPEGGGLPTWGRGGRELYYWHRNTRYAVPMEPGEEARPGTPVPLYTLETQQAGKDVMQDGERFLVTRGDPGSERRLRLLLNWTALLER